MTIDWFQVNLENCFAIGQACVACSRGKSVNSMYVKSFNHREIKTSNLVKKFYAALHDEMYSPPIWAESVGNFDESTQAGEQLKETMRREYGSRRCRRCGEPCTISKVKTNTSGNVGRWYIRCSRVYCRGHTFEFVPVRIM